MGEEGFKHIAVNVADDDDFVIRVGASESEPSAEPVAERVVEPTVEAVVEAIAETAEAAEVSEVVEAPNKAKVAAGEGQRRPRKDDGYHETTLEDLKGEKMPFAQRVVIIAAVICIIGAVIYYFAFMR